MAVVNKCAIIRCNQGLLSHHHHHHHRKIDDLRQVGFGLCFLRRKCFKQRGAARLWRREHLLADQLKRSQRWCRVIVITPRQRQLEQSVALRLQACTVEGGVLYQHNINQQPCRAGARQKWQRRVHQQKGEGRLQLQRPSGHRPRSQGLPSGTSCRGQAPSIGATRTATPGWASVPGCGFLSRERGLG